MRLVGSLLGSLGSGHSQPPCAAWTLCLLRPPDHTFTHGMCVLSLFPQDNKTPPFPPELGDKNTPDPTRGSHQPCESSTSDTGTSLAPQKRPPGAVRAAQGLPGNSGPGAAKGRGRKPAPCKATRQPPQRRRGREAGHFQGSFLAPPGSPAGAEPEGQQRRAPQSPGRLWAPEPRAPVGTPAACASLSAWQPLKWSCVDCNSSPVIHVRFKIAFFFLLTCQIKLFHTV